MLGHVGNNAAQLLEHAMTLMRGMDSRRGLSRTRVWAAVVCTAEDLEGWVTFNAMRLAKGSLFCAVNLGKLDILLLQCCRSLFVLWGKGLAVSTGLRVSKHVDHDEGGVANLPPRLRKRKQGVSRNECIEIRVGHTA